MSANVAWLQNGTARYQAGREGRTVIIGDFDHVEGWQMPVGKGKDVDGVRAWGICIGLVVAPDVDGAQCDGKVLPDRHTHGPGVR